MPSRPVSSRRTCPLLPRPTRAASTRSACKPLSVLRNPTTSAASSPSWHPTMRGGSPAIPSTSTAAQSSERVAQMTANDLKLYQSAAPPNSRRVRIFLAEKGLTVPLVPVDLAKGEQHSEAYRAINPRRVVPTLVLEDGTAIGEVLAIWRYLEEAYPTPPLLGSTPKDKALVTMWER